MRILMIVSRGLSIRRGGGSAIFVFLLGAQQDMGGSVMASKIRVRWLLVAVALVFAMQAVGMAGPTIYNFTNGLSLTAGSGNLGYMNDTGTVAAFGTASSFGIPGDTSPVMYLPASPNNTRGLQFDSGVVSGNGGGTRINDYTFAFDVLLPSITAKPYFAFFNADVTKGGASPNQYPVYNDPNTSDADFWMYGGAPTSTAVTGGIGVSGIYQGALADNTWTRVAVTVHNAGTTGQQSTDGTTTLTCYENGVQVNSVTMYGTYYPNPPAPAKIDRLPGIDGRWSLATTGAGLTWLFTDNDGETNDAYINRVFFEDRILSSSEIAAMGGVTLILPGDANKSGTVNVADLTLLLNNYNRAGMAWADGDFTNDGTVNVADLTLLLNNYNKTSGAGVAAGSAVPEPSSIVMLVGIALTALLYGWRKLA
jgi:hypothetical protein